MMEGHKVLWADEFFIIKIFRVVKGSGRHRTCETHNAKYLKLRLGWLPLPLVLEANRD